MSSDDAGPGRPFQSASRQERAQRYRDMADAAFLKAQRVENPEIRAEFLNLATGWHAMALEIEKGLERPIQPQENPARDGANAQKP